MAALFLLGFLLSASAPDTVTAAPPETLRIATVQMPVTAGMDANLQRIETGIVKAKAAGARVVVFPETALTGLSREAIAAVDWSRLQAAVDTIKKCAKDAGLYVIFGTATQSTTGKPYNTAIVLGPDGEEIARYHKNFPESWFQPGDHMTLFAIDGVPCTLIICHDSRFPEFVRAPVLAGARI